MRVNLKLQLTAAALVACTTSVAAMAQDRPDLTGMSGSELRSEIVRRYDDALRLTLDPTVVAADDTRHVWASQAKAQCGIAIGFLKSGYRDPVSIGKCDDAWRRMQLSPPVAYTPPPPPPPNPACNEPIAGIVFFDWDSAVPPDSSTPTIDAVASNVTACGWRGLAIIGHTDRSGSDSYNDALSIRRANAVTGALSARGVPGGMLEVSGRGEAEPRVPTMDGERNPQNRRVEITVK